MSLNQMILCSKLKNGLFKIFTKSQVVTKFNVSKSRLHCTYIFVIDGIVFKFLKSKLGLYYKTFADTKKNQQVITFHRTIEKGEMK